VKFLDLMDEASDETSLRTFIASFDPEIIGISVRNVDDQNMEKPRFLLEQVKKVVTVCRKYSDALIVLGGAGYSIFPESALNYLEADMGIQGEGESSFPLLLKYLERSNDIATVPGLYLRGSGRQGERLFEKNLDRFLLPHAETASLRPSEQEDFWIPIQTRRGCPMACSYCSTATIEGRLIRKRHPDSIMDQIAGYANAGFKRFYFVDNIFNIPGDYAEKICRKIIESRLSISWRCIIYPWQVGKELINLMQKAGCIEVSLGFESGCERILRSMNKKYSPEDVRRISQMFRESGIKQTGFLLLGGPGETKTSILESLAFADLLRLDALKITIGIRIYPETLLAKIAIDEGRIRPQDNLLHPRFYVVSNLGDWLCETAHNWVADRPNWVS